MSDRFLLEQFDPLPLRREGVFEGASEENQLVALDIVTKYQFVDVDGKVYHEYTLPSNADMHNAGGYVDKLVKYRDPQLREHFGLHGVNHAALLAEDFPILSSRSPQLDLLLFKLMGRIRKGTSRKVSFFDLGCTVCEHWDMLNAMLLAESNGREGAADVLRYFGLDKSVMLLSIGRLLHSEVAPQLFQLFKADGAHFAFAPDSIDLTLSVGVVNHVSDPPLALDNLLTVTGQASVLALWVIDGEEGFWSTIHSGLPFYTFSMRDLLALEQKHQGRFYYTDYVPEQVGSQQKSFIGIGAGKISRMGCYHLVFSKIGEPPFWARPLAEAARAPEVQQ